MFHLLARVSIVLSLFIGLPLSGRLHAADNDPGQTTEQDLQTATLLANLGILANQQNHFALAESKLRASRALLQKIDRLNTPSGRLVVSSLALSIQKQGRFAEAQTLYEDAMAETRLHAGEQNAEFASFLSNLALLSFEAGKYREALQQNRQALDIRRALKDKEPQIVSLNNLGQCLAALGHPREAEPLLEEAIALERTSRNGPYPQLSDSLINLAVLEKNDGRLDAAQQHASEALRIVEQYADKDHPDLAIVWNNLGLVALARKDFKEARKRFDQAIDLWTKIQGAPDARYAATLSNLAALESVQGHHKKARALFENAVQIDEERLGSAHTQTASDLANLASELFYARKYDDAIVLFQRAELAQEEAIGPGSLKAAEVSADLAITYQAAKRWTDAIAAYRKAIHGLEASAGLDSPRLGAILRSYALVLRKTDQFGEAEQAETRALGIQVRNTLKQSSSSGDTKESVGGLTFR